MLVALVVGGIAIILNGFGGDDAVLAGDGTEVVEPSPSESASPSGSAVGLGERERCAGARASGRRRDDPGPQRHRRGGARRRGRGVPRREGLRRALPAADAAQKPVETTIVYFRTGEDAEQNEVDADHLAGRYLKGVEAQVKLLSAALGSDVAPKTQLVVLLGNDYAEANPVG